MRFHAILRLLPLSPLLLAACASTPATIDLDRPAVIGASVSAGFGLQVNLTDGIALALDLERDAILDGGRLFFFLDPEGTGVSLVQLVQAFDPSVVVAMDFLFWFTYGDLDGVQERLDLLERGLAFLDELDAPILVTTVPNMEASIGLMLTRPMVPLPAALARINERITDWAAVRPHVRILDLPDLLSHLKSREPVEFAGRSWPVEEGQAYLQADHLHPTTSGMAFVVCALLERLSPGRPLDPQALGRQLEGLQAARRQKEQ
jgi:hypothetical protein